MHLFLSFPLFPASTDGKAVPIDVVPFLLSFEKTKTPQTPPPNPKKTKGLMVRMLIPSTPLALKTCP